MDDAAARPLELNAVINEYRPIHLSQMNGVSLMERIDTKFLFHGSQLCPILENAVNRYKVLEIDGLRTQNYNNQYFDTNNRKFYMDHHNGKGNRIKVRIREYTESKKYFLEVKKKSNKGRTSKKRHQLNDFQTRLSTNSQNFVTQQTGFNIPLVPMLRNSFQRITLVDDHSRERATFDMYLSFDDGENELDMGPLVIAEIKQPVFNRASKLFQILKQDAINPYRISKYCIGMASLYDDLKYNAFKEKIIKINKILAA
ncbi:polyphosphate polymerase domain-containing protein [Flavobacteriaceae bacterium TP-CH-4]|uniref:Polyphosphate polymerase domain-containing protein n=1 Tax=Pelagihabitans pacificus TaxID=2696054 RepID=A0A967EE08_9FLAO|nr:polyphosphate polymerase domain-containing protein [Pelagihabitans pacificus]NHF59898.1 polyphosphate polymerase domain-containing protein [Pelagihabitans pacificus]